MKRSAIILLVVSALCSSFLFADTDAGLVNNDMSFKTSVPVSDYKDYLEKGVRSDSTWYIYPKTFETYNAIMLSWETRYPNLCKLYTLGFSTIDTHAIYALKISANVNQYTRKPRYLQTATIHGDELSNYMTTLHMIDTLLFCYGKDARITALLDSITFYFCPLCNPDVTYWKGSLITGPLINKPPYDLNRNYPCSCLLGSTSHKYGMYTQFYEETKALLTLTHMYRFNLHTDLHCGTEAAYWPYAAIIRKHCDENWFVWASDRFIDQAHNDCNNNGYYTSAGGDGMGNFFKELFEAHGTRIDYMTFHNHCKGLNFESSISKIIPASELRNHWTWLKESLFQYYELLYTGIQGVVVDAKTKQPIINAHIYSNKPDEFTDSADVYTDSAGAYVRFIDPGTYTMTFSHPEYYPKTAEVQVTDLNKKYILSVELDPLPVKIDAISLKKLGITIIPHSRGVRVNFHTSTHDNVQVGIYTLKGSLVTLLPVNSRSIAWDCKNSTGAPVAKGCYIIKIKTGRQEFSRSFIIGEKS